MNDLFSPPQDPLKDGYSRIYNCLSELREELHRSGRLDDSNAKLDEVSKLFATYLAFKNGQIPNFPTETSSSLIEGLHSAFAATVKLPNYTSQNGCSIFGIQPTLVIREGDESLAQDLVKLVRNCIDLAFILRTDNRPFDILNEAFGHFVRDNFRGNVEDAQYMTPPEVVDFIVDMVLSDLKNEESDVHDSNKHWTVLDPSCGVGSFLAAVYNRAKCSDWLNPKHLRLFGQDKVERMARLSTINLELFDVEEHRITVDNSLEYGSAIDHLNDSVDIILTNPPFGAKFNSDYITTNCRKNTPFFSELRRTTASIDSELLFLDRNLKLLREGGRLLIVVPDGVVSAKGIASLLRQHLAGVATLRAVIELPSTTFAQAGTRTKTAILYLQKGQSKKSIPVFMGISKNLGFQVSSRKGVQIKIPDGDNDLPLLLESYKNMEKDSCDVMPQVLSIAPSSVSVPKSIVLSGSWTPNHYSAARFETVAAIGSNNEFDLILLKDLVVFCSNSRKSEAWSEGWAFISVLHILGEGFIDIGAAMSYAPKTAGVLTKPKELLMSRINPRIPRVCVTPELDTKILCSSEFEVMQVINNKIDVYLLAYLLQTKVVQNQVLSLTSGTSASHNRIRTSELGQVLIPIPKEGTKAAVAIKTIAKDYRMALESLSQNATTLAKIRNGDSAIFSF